MKLLVLAVPLAAALAVGCKKVEVGLPCLTTPIFCDFDADCPAEFRCARATGTCIEVAGASETGFTTDALECASAVCVQMQGADVGLCTKRCGSNSDCDEADTSSCESGFVCVEPIGIPSSELGCAKLCVCRDHAEANGLYADGGVVPLACRGAE